MVVAAVAMEAGGFESAVDTGNLLHMFCADDSICLTDHLNNNLLVLYHSTGYSS